MAPDYNEKLSTFNTWAIIPTWFFATYLLKQYTKPPATKARSDPEAISHYDKKVTVKKSSQNFIYLFIYFLLFSQRNHLRLADKSLIC